MDRETIISEIKKSSQTKGSRTISRSDFLSYSGISEWQILKYFDSWTDAVQAAGLKPKPKNVRIADVDLFREMKNVFIKLGTVCNRRRFSKNSGYSVEAYKRHFGKWDDVLK
jgi:hypothetical protein